MQSTTQDQKAFTIIYRLAHLAELYDQFSSYSAERNEVPESLKSFADRLALEGAPFGDGMALKQTAPSNTLVPIFELYELYKGCPDRPEISIADFAQTLKLVDRFRREKGFHGITVVED